MSYLDTHPDSAGVGECEMSDDKWVSQPSTMVEILLNLTVLGNSHATLALEIPAMGDCNLQVIKKLFLYTTPLIILMLTGGER